MRGSRRIVVIVIALVIGTGVLLSPLGIPPLIYPESEYIPAFGGYFYISEIQNDNENVSYSIIFHDVNFTFLYWHWPYSVLDNVTNYFAEVPLDVFVQVTFSDNTSEILHLVVDSPGSCLIGESPELRGVTTSHSQPRAGVANAETWELQSRWVYTVSVS